MSLYLKYRPNDFDNLMWQSFVKETLQKAISQNKTVWAYLLCWPRWTWKTTTARLLAKTINCLNPVDWNPCNKCEICKSFAEDKLTDIIEIDAASHTWVDNIRELIERAQFTPNKTKYKIYIIDEVHMLSKWAFNALLKILEEPPTHVKFILATTETNKVPETIISRCQRYDFKRINNLDIQKRLEYISEKEGITVDQESYDYIVSNSAGWLRNAISLYEQMIVDWQIDFQNLVEKLWIIQKDQLDNILNKLLTKDTSIIEDINYLIDSGKNIKIFFKDLIFYTKEKIIEKLNNKENINNDIFILDTLNKSFSDSKNSLDENITLMIWVFKIIGWYTEKQTIIEKPVVSNNIPNTKKITKENISAQEKKSVPEPILESEKNLETNLWLDDVSDIFWFDNTDSSVENSTPTKQEKTYENHNFDSSSFISKLKTQWAKWALTMALRWSQITFEWNILKIKSSTAITRKSVENVDNIALMIWVLWQMWFENPKIEIL